MNNIFSKHMKNIVCDSRNNHQDVVAFDSGAEKGNVKNHADEGEEGSARKLDCILEWAQKAGMKTGEISNCLNYSLGGRLLNLSSGIVTDTRLSHATPAALYANSASRDWECDSKLPKNAPDYGNYGNDLATFEF
jgi:alkaline phosphatase